MTDEKFWEAVRAEERRISKAIRFDINDKNPFFYSGDAYDRHVHQVIRRRYMDDEISLEDAIRAAA